MTPSSGGAPGTAMTVEELTSGAPILRIGELLGIVRRNIWMITALTTLFGALAYFLVARERAVYSARALIRVIDPSEGVTQSVAGVSQRSASRAEPITSEIVVLTGRAVAGAVVDSLGLRLFDVAEQGRPSWARDIRVTAAPDENLALEVSFSDQSLIVSAGSARARAEYGTAVELKGVRFIVRRKPAVLQADLVVMPRDAAIDFVVAGLGAREREGTNAVDVSYSATQRRLAIEVVNRTVTEYRALSASAARQSDRQRILFLKNQLAEYESALRAAQAELAEFRGRNQVYRSTERFSAEQQAMLQVEMRRREYESDQRTYQALLDQLDKPSSSAAALRSLAAATDIAASPVVTRMFTELTALETTRDSLIASGKLPAHMLVRQIEERIAGSERRLADAVRSQVVTLGGRAGEMEKMLVSSAAEMGKLSSAEAEETRLNQRVTSVQGLWERLREEYQLARMSEAVDVGKVQIVDLATRATRQSSPKLLKLILGAGAGLLLALAIAFVREHMNTSIRRRADIERLLRVPGLAVIPRMKAPRRWRVSHLLGGRNRNGDAASRLASTNGSHRHHDNGATPPGLAALSRGASQAEVFRSLRTRLLLSHSSRTLRVIVVTSAHGEDGKTTTASNLAVAFAQQGFRVVLVDGDLRKPCLHQLLGVAAEPGFVDALSDLVTVDEAVQLSTIPRLYVMACGSRQPDAPELLKADCLTRVFRSLAKRFDLVLVDSPPLQAAPDGAILAAHADGAIVVLRAGRTERAAARQVVDELTDVGASVVGAVLNDPDAEAAKYPDYSAEYSYAT